MVRVFGLLSVLFGLATIAVAQENAPACHVRSSRLYIDAQFTHTRAAAAAIPLEPDVIRNEGTPQRQFTTARSAVELRASLVAGTTRFFFTGQPAPINPGQSDPVDIGDIVDTVVVAAYFANLRGFGRSRVIQYFSFDSVEDCQIASIEASYEPEPLT